MDLFGDINNLIMIYDNVCRDYRNTDIREILILEWSRVGYKRNRNLGSRINGNS